MNRINQYLQEHPPLANELDKYLADLDRDEQGAGPTVDEVLAAYDTAREAGFTPSELAAYRAGVADGERRQAAADQWHMLQALALGIVGGALWGTWLAGLAQDFWNWAFN